MGRLREAALTQGVVNPWPWKALFMESLALDSPFPPVPWHIQPQVKERSGDQVEAIRTKCQLKITRSENKNKAQVPCTSRQNPPKPKKEEGVCSADPCLACYSQNHRVRKCLDEEPQQKENLRTA